MAGVALRANCSESDINSLNKIINGQYRETIKKRARCVILSNQGMLNKDIAETVEFMPRIVGNWIRRFNELGISGLFDIPKPGRRDNANYDLGDRIRALIQEKPPENADSWSAQLLATQLGVSVNVVWSVCRNLGISFQRNRQWTYDTHDEMTPHVTEVVGIFCSDEERAIVVRTDYDNDCTNILRGTFVTHNKDLADEIKVITERKSNESGSQASISLSEILTVATEHATDQRRFADVPMYGYLNDLMDVLPSGHHNNYLVISYSPENNAFSGLNRSGYTFSLASSKEDWLHQAEGFLRTQCNLTMEEEKLVSSLRRYSEGINSKTEPFMWWKRPVANEALPVGTDNIVGSSGKGPEKVLLTENEESVEKQIVPNSTNKPRIDVQIKYTDSYGNETSQILSVTEGLMETQSCDLGSIDSVVEFTENITSHIIPLMDRAAQQLGTMALESVKKNQVLTVVKDTWIETRAGRLPCTITGLAAKTLSPKERLRTRDFLAIEGYCLSTMKSYRSAINVLNMITRRSNMNNNLINFATAYEDEQRIGKEVEEKFNEVCFEALNSAKIKLDEQGVVTDCSPLNETLAAMNCSQTIINVEQHRCTGIDSEAADDLLGKIGHYNEECDTQSQIHGTHAFEDPLHTIYCTVDDVLVHLQSRKVVRKNGHECVKTQGAWVYHTVAHIEVDTPVTQEDGAKQVITRVYTFEAKTQELAFSHILAFLIKNKLTDRYLVFFTDGEETLKTIPDRIFKDWPHVHYMDYYHLKERMSEIFSRAFKPGKIVDDTVELEYFKNGKVKKSSIKKITRSQYYLRILISILWVGNVEEAKAWLEKMTHSSELKANGIEAIKEATGYLERKGARIPCYFLRKLLGLRNTSNSVEISNNILVARRQKKKGCSWAVEGSFACSEITCIYANEDAESYFTNGVISFKLRHRATDPDFIEGLEWIRDMQINIDEGEIITTSYPLYGEDSECAA